MHANQYCRWYLLLLAIHPTYVYCMYLSVLTNNRQMNAMWFLNVHTKWTPVHVVVVLATIASASTKGMIVVQCGALKCSQIFHNGHVIARSHAIYGVSFVKTHFELYSSWVTAVLYVIWCYVGSRYNGAWSYLNLKMWDINICSLYMTNFDVQWLYYPLDLLTSIYISEILPGPWPITCHIKVNLWSPLPAIYKFTFYKNAFKALVCGYILGTFCSNK